MKMFKAIAKFIHEVRVELAKVTWPTRQSAINLTLIVVGVSLLFMVYIGAVDYGLTAGIKWLTATAEKVTSGNNANGISPNGIEVTPQ